jgi:DNA-binding LacI/PurR family transcriptional regulator
MAQNPDITAICAVNDSMAIGAIRWLQKEGRRIPEDVSVVGFDDIQWASLNTPPLTTVAIPKMQMGKEAGNRLISLLNDPDSVPIEVIISVEFIQRDSTRDCIQV